MYSASKDLVQSLQRAPSVREEFWPSEYDAEDITYEDVYLDTSKAFLNALLLVMQQNYAQFIMFAADGLYSGDRGSAKFNSSGGNLNIGLNTYVTTSYLQQSGWFGEFQGFVFFTRFCLEPLGMFLAQVVHRISELANFQAFNSRPWQISSLF